MNKILNISIASLLTMGLFVSTLAAAPSSISPDQPKISTLVEPQPAPEETTTEAFSASEQLVQAAATVAPSTSPDSATSAPRPRTQSQSVSRGTTTTSTSSKAAAIISTAKKYMGVKYVWGGTTPSGFDCSGFTQYVFAQQGISLPRISGDQYSQGRSVSMSNLQPGDLIFFSLDGDKIIDHVGIYTGNGQFINASSSKGVTIYSLGSYWKSHYIGAKRVL